MSEQHALTVREIYQVIRRLIFVSWRERALFITPIAITLALGITVAFGSGVEYTSSTRLIPYRGASSQGLGGLAGIAGIRLPAGNSAEQVVSVNLYPEVVQTFDFKIAVAETPIRFSQTIGEVAPVDYFRFTHKPTTVDRIIEFVSGGPSAIIAPTLALLNNRPSLKKAGDSIPSRMVDQQYRDLVESIAQRITLNVDARTGIVSIAARLPDPVASANLVRSATSKLTATITRFDVRKAEEQLRYVENHFAIAKKRYEDAQLAVATFADRNRSLNSAVRQTELDRLQREATLAFDIYQQFSRQREDALIQRSRDTPAFAELDPPSVPASRSGPNRGLILLVAGFVGLFVGAVRLALRQL